MTEQEQKAFEQMREALTYYRDECSGHEPSLSVFQLKVDDALTAANAVSHPKTETAPAPESRAITSESAANAVSEQAQERKDLMWSTVAMQERHDQRIENTVATLEKIKQEQSARYQPVKESFWWRVRIGNGTQTIGRCYTETEAQRLAAELQRAFNDGAFCVEKVVCSGDLIGAAHPQATEPAGWRLVPVEPTQEMLGCIVHSRYPEDWHAGKALQMNQRGESRVPFKTEYEIAVGQYQRMLAAAPEAL